MGLQCFHMFWFCLTCFDSGIDEANYAVFDDVFVLFFGCLKLQFSSSDMGILLNGTGDQSPIYSPEGDGEERKQLDLVREESFQNISQGIAGEKGNHIICKFNS